MAFLARELALLHRARAIVALGAFAWAGTLRALATRERPRFGHGARAFIGRYALVGCYHPSQLNTFTGRLTASMIDAVLCAARAG